MPLSPRGSRNGAAMAARYRLRSHARHSQPHPGIRGRGGPGGAHGQHLRQPQHDRRGGRRAALRRRGTLRHRAKGRRPALHAQVRHRENADGQYRGARRRDGTARRQSVGLQSLTGMEARAKPRDSDLTGEFTRLYYAEVDPEELSARVDADLNGAAAAHLAFGKSYAGGSAKLRVYNPIRARDGWASTHTVVEIVNDDVPF